MHESYFYLLYLVLPTTQVRQSEAQRCSEHVQSPPPLQLRGVLKPSSHLQRPS